MRLVQGCLDKQLTDRRRRKMGRVDGIVLTLAPGQRPRVAWIEIGAVTRARRLHPWVGRVVAACSRRLGGAGVPYRLPFADVTPAGIIALAAVDADETPALAWERRLRRAIVGRIPGA